MSSLTKGTVRVKVRQDTAANWTSADPTLDSGEFGFETDTGYLKCGDGTTVWTILVYVNTDNVQGVKIKSSSGGNVTDGYVLTATGGGTSAWEASAGGGLNSIIASMVFG